MTIRHFNLNAANSTWRPHITQALQQMDADYLENLYKSQNWLPGPDKIFNAFSLPIDQVKYVLFGESPYPRAASANGFAFWDEAVSEIWSENGLSKPVNRATSLRNIIKMLLVAEGLLSPTQTGQECIAQLDKTPFVKTNTELFSHFLQHGFLLLNATPVLQPTAVRKDALAWHPFIKHIMDVLINLNPNIELLLFGKIANIIDNLIDKTTVKKLYSEHPYNLSFITNPDVLGFFKPLHLLSL
jgi:uracil-DNA glycosylase